MHDRLELIREINALSPAGFDRFIIKLFVDKEHRKKYWHRLFGFRNATFLEKELIKANYSNAEIVALFEKLELSPDVVSSSETALIEPETSVDIIEISAIQDLLDDIPPTVSIRVEGRSILFNLEGSDEIIVLKFQKKQEDASLLVHESKMMDYVAKIDPSMPTPLGLFTVQDVRAGLLELLDEESYAKLTELTDLSSQALTILRYKAADNYFHYLNSPEDSIEQFSTNLIVVFNKLFELAKYHNLYHHDLIPLFHRTERDIKEFRGDSGGFIVSHDLDPCEGTPMGNYDLRGLHFPNLSSTAPRDFKNLRGITESESLNYGVYGLFKRFKPLSKRKFTFFEAFSKYLFTMEAMITSRAKDIDDSNIQYVVNAVSSILVNFMHLSGAPQELCKEFVDSFPIEQYVNEIIFWSKKTNREITTSHTTFFEKVRIFHPDLDIENESFDKYKPAKTATLRGTFASDHYKERIGFPNSPYPILKGSEIRYGFVLMMLALHSGIKKHGEFTMQFIEQAVTAAENLGTGMEIEPENEASYISTSTPKP